MNREILFKGETPGTNKWVEGTGVLNDGINTWLVKNKPNTAIKLGEEYFIVNPETVGQYTGFIDKNGNKIFEGDILSTGNPDEFFGVVEWIEENSGFAVSFNGLVETFEELILLDKVELEIIGNIHDNPELLES